MRARRIGQALLIFVPLLICGMRLHARMVGTPTGVTQEVARCLNLVRIVAARRNGKHAPAGRTGQRAATESSRTIS